MLFDIVDGSELWAGGLGLRTTFGVLVLAVFVLGLRLVLVLLSEIGLGFRFEHCFSRNADLR